MEDEKWIPYRVTGYEPQTHSGDMNCFSFNILLEHKSAVALRNIPYYTGEAITQRASDCLRTLFGNRVTHGPYRFMKMPDGQNYSSLISSCTVPGNACELCIEWELLDNGGEYHDGRRWVRYYTHNVDSAQQAYALLSLWLMWMDTAHVLIGKTLEIQR